MYFSLEVIDKLESEFGSFVLDRVIGGSNENFLRFRAWSRVSQSKLQEVVGDEAIIEEQELDDDERGILYSYRFYKK